MVQESTTRIWTVPSINVWPKSVEEQVPCYIHGDNHWSVEKNNCGKKRYILLLTISLFTFNYFINFRLKAKSTTSIENARFGEPMSVPLEPEFRMRVIPMTTTNLRNHGGVTWFAAIRTWTQTTLHEAFSKKSTMWRREIKRWSVAETFRDGTTMSSMKNIPRWR